ncbi:T9SS type A sorting domain-containing protein, partial [Spirosoma soli]
LSLSAQALPAGLRLEGPSLMGVPTGPGSTTVVLVATDPQGLSASVSFVVRVVAAPASALSVALQASPTQVTVGGSTTLTAQASGGTAPYNFSFSGPGSLSVVGNVAVFSGLPLGEQSFTVVVSDASQPTPQQLSVGVSVTVAEPSSQTQPQTGPFSITGVETVRCEVVSGGQRQVTFQPQYAGITGAPVSFSVVNELVATEKAGPYTLNLYTDNPTITLKATQQGTVGEATYLYNWLGACPTQPSARLGSGGAFEPGLRVRVLGNPTEGESVDVIIEGAGGESVQLRLVDERGRWVSEQRVSADGVAQPVRVELGRGAGVYVLEVSTSHQHQTVKILKR